VGKLHTKSEFNHMIPSAEIKFLFLVTITFDLDLHDPQSIGFFLSLSTGHMTSLVLIAYLHISSHTKFDRRISILGLVFMH